MITPVTKSETQLNAEVIKINEPIAISGPFQMLNKLRNFLPAYERADLLLIWLDDQDQALQINHRFIGEGLPPHLLELQKTGEREKLIVIFRADTKMDAQEEAKRFNLTQIDPLDVLLIAGDRWWSFLCSNDDCCPKDGRELPRRNGVDSNTFADRHEIWLQWLNALNFCKSQVNTFEMAPDMETQLRKSLNDLAIRDCVLNHLATNTDSHNAWLSIFNQMISGSQTHNNQVVYCLMAAVYFCQHNLVDAEIFTKKSLEIDPTYSLSKLMEHGLEIKMKSEKIIAAFTHYCADELLRNTPVATTDFD